MPTTKSRYPTGVRALMPEETARRRAIETRLVAALGEGGFDEVVLPIIDYVDHYAPLLGRELMRQSYRFTDREGDLVFIRSDFTPMVARALAPAIAPEELPRKVFYRGDVIRCEASRLGVNRELFQIGAEIIGDASVDADVEILTLAARLLCPFGIRPTIVYNDVAIVEQLMASLGVGPEVERPIRAALVAKRTAELRDFRDQVPAAPFALIEKLANGSATLADFSGYGAERLAAIERGVEGVEGADFILHLDDVEETAGYYTGLRFRIYADESRTRIAQGGRYDALYGRFGTAAAAIGFTFTIDDLGSLAQ